MSAGGALLSGGALVIARRFSAKRFWEEVSAHNCTVIQYIGELARYLVGYAKKNPYVYNIPHTVRLAMGNGIFLAYFA